ncbi:hypothetical protein A5844_001090 [Enterococcus sp. 10A9_DIV0425]|uniref:Uncharacterized protein n=1 Tax=Candidatus Enterococcus wittei TaxID=1987383 RepID=A0A242K1M9_9ENTE|nr:hypothetical protein A5844_001090 [Enterococcus sp. 10A9_DIV0425]
MLSESFFWNVTFFLTHLISS